jgi:hypothetical protein
MKTIMTVVMAMALSNFALADDSTSPLSLEITVDKGVVTGYVRNTSTNVVKVNSRHLYGHWEFTSVFYLYGRGQEAPYVEKPRGRIGTVLPPVEIELKPGEVLVSPETDLNRIAVPAKPAVAKYTFTIDLSDHVLPANFWDVSELRVVTCGLWSNIIKIGNPNQSLKATGKPALQP